MIGIGTRVLLKHCPHGEPGTVIRIERNRAVVLWHDLDFLARHSPENLMESPEHLPQFSVAQELSA